MFTETVWLRVFRRCDMKRVLTGFGVGVLGILLLVGVHATAQAQDGEGYRIQVFALTGPSCPVVS